MRTHERLEVWKKSVDFVVLVYKATNSFPSEEKFGLISQIRRASVSIPSNIAEGAARSSNKEFLHFLSISQGSTSEVETQLLIAHRLNFLDEKTYFSLRNDLDEIGKMLSGLRKHLYKKEESNES